MRDRHEGSSRPALKVSQANITSREDTSQDKTLSTQFSALARAVAFPFRYWNWKTASITAAIRGAAFLLALGHHHGSNGSKGAMIEVVYVS